MDDATEQITLDELIRLAIDARMADVHTSMPAVVTSYDRGAGTVSVSIPINKMVPDGSGNFVSEAFPSLQDVPIEWPRCGKFAITFPLAVGDTGRLSLCQQNISAWRTTGEQGAPGDTGMHTLDGAVFQPGLSDDSSPPGHASADNMVIGSETDAKGRLVCKPAGGELGEGATKGIARDGDPIDLGDCHVVVVMGVVTSVFINGVALPAVADPGGNRGTISSGSTTWKCED